PVDRHVVGDALPDRDPHRVGREYEWPVLAEGRMDGCQKWLTANSLDHRAMIIMAALDSAAEHSPDGFVRPTRGQWLGSRRHLIDGERHTRLMQGLMHGCPPVSSRLST